MASGNGRDFLFHPSLPMRPLFVFAHLNCWNIWVRLISSWFHTLFAGSPANLMLIALLWNRGLRPLSIIACLVLGQKGKSSFSARTGNSDWTGSWGDFWSVWHFVLPFDEYTIKFWYPHLQRFQRSSDNCGKIHVRIILGHPILRQSLGLLKLIWRFWDLKCKHAQF